MDRLPIPAVDEAHRFVIVMLSLFCVSRIRNIEQHAADNVDKILVGNKCDMMSEKLVETARGQALADEYGIKFFETSAKSNINVVESFTATATDIKKRLMDNPAAGGAGQGAGGVKVGGNQGGAAGQKEGGCCK